MRISSRPPCARRATTTSSPSGSASPRGSWPALPSGGPLLRHGVAVDTALQRRLGRHRGSGARPTPASAPRRAPAACAGPRPSPPRRTARAADPVAVDAAILAKVVGVVGDRVRAEQTLFDRTGGVHAAAAFDLTTGEVLAAREDVGRHNAVDKVVGRLLLDGALPATGLGLWVSGRASFEMVQKAWAGGFAVLAVGAAPRRAWRWRRRRAGLTLAGFARDGGLVTYRSADPDVLCGHGRRHEGQEAEARTRPRHVGRPVAERRRQAEAAPPLGDGLGRLAGAGPPAEGLEDPERGRVRRLHARGRRVPRLDDRRHPPLHDPGCACSI